ncbi:exported hypothetical protein [Plantibacter sp. T3]|nr:exported hypothetical protein [Plantibacter sp. T3]
MPRSSPPSSTRHSGSASAAACMCSSSAPASSDDQRDGGLKHLSTAFVDGVTVQVDPVRLTPRTPAPMRSCTARRWRLHHGGNKRSHDGLERHALRGIRAHEPRHLRGGRVRRRLEGTLGGIQHDDDPRGTARGCSRLLLLDGVRQRTHERRIPAGAHPGDRGGLLHPRHRHHRQPPARQRGRTRHLRGRLRAHRHGGEGGLPGLAGARRHPDHPRSQPRVTTTVQQHEQEGDAHAHRDRRSLRAHRNGARALPRDRRP